MPSLQQLRYLVAIADTAHFGRAAERCNVSQPTLSGQLKELERRLAGQLVERDRKARVILTPLGREVVGRARRVLRDVEDIRALARRGGPHPVGTIRLGAVPTLGAYFLSLVVPDLHGSFPDLRLFVREASSDSLVTFLEDGQLDAILLPLPVRSEHLEQTPLLVEPLMAVVAADHPLATRTVLGPDDLRGETVLALEPGHRLHVQVEELCAAVGARVARDFEGTSLDTLRLMVGMGIGVAFLPALYIRTEALKDPAVKVLRFAPDPPSRQVGLVWRKRAARGEAFHTLAERMRSVFEGGIAEVRVERPR
ncbi:MAG: LysR substrate-binding domain-containing protein [Pseudomonadota bacterium]